MSNFITRDIFNLCDKVFLGDTEVDNINLGDTAFLYANNYIADSHFSNVPTGWEQLHGELQTLDTQVGYETYTALKFSVTGQATDIFTRIAVKPENYQACNAGEVWRCGINYYIEDYTTIDSDIQIAVSFYQEDKTTVVGSTVYASFDRTSNGHKFKTVMFTIPANAKYIRYLFHMKRNGTVWLYMPRLQLLSPVFT